MTICGFKNPPGVGVNVVGDKIIVDGELVEIDGQAWPPAPVDPPVDPPAPSSDGAYLNVKWFGAKLDGVTDDTAAIQAAVDDGSAPVFIPRVPNNVRGALVSQIKIGTGTVIRGGGSGTIYNPGTRLKQIPGFNGSMFVPRDTMPIGEWVHQCQISDLLLEGDENATAGCGIEMTRRTGENFLLSNLMVFRFAESGIRLNRGSTPGGIFNCASFQNGEYGFDLRRQMGDPWHMFYLRSVSGDNNGQALIRVKDYGAEMDMICIDGVKAETRDDPTKQQDVIVLDNLNHSPISIQNVTSYSIAQTRSIVRIVGTGARVVARNFRATSGCANWIYDETGTAPRFITRRNSPSAALIDGVWASHLPDPAVNVKLSLDY